MEEIINGKNLDSILEYCLKKHKVDNGYIDLYELRTKLFPDFTEDEILSLIKFIKNSSLDVLEIHITTNPCVNINGITKRFFENGGFTKIESDSNSKSDFLKEKEILEFDNLKLEKENSEYKLSIRNKDEAIIKLTTKNLRLQNKQMKRYLLYSIIGFIAGAIITNLKDILILLNIIHQ